MITNILVFLYYKNGKNDFLIFIYTLKEIIIMKTKIENKKVVVSISLDPELLNILNETFGNRSKFLENCVISELCKSEEMKTLLKNKYIIL